jgi:hypothetical protein
MSSDPYILAQTQAIYDILNKTDVYFYRKVARWYSTTFHTPLSHVDSIPYDELLLHYYEYHYDKLPYNEVFRLANELLPELAGQKEAEDEEFIKNLLEAEEAKKQSLNKESKPTTNKIGDITTLIGQPPTQQPKQEVFKTFDIDEDEEP